MNGSELGEGSMKMEVIEKEKLVYMWGYLPGAMPQRSPLLSPIIVGVPQQGIGNAGNYSWKDVCGGGCGFAMAISDSGKIITWGSTDDLGQCYVTSGRHGEIPEPFPLPDEISIVKAAAGWAHCVAVTETGEVYTWGWKECIPSGKFLGEQVVDKEGSRSKVGAAPGIETRGGEDGAKRRRVSSVKQPAESSSSGDEGLSALPCLVTLNPGVRIVSVAAGGRHTLALSDIGQVWGWGYGGEGQLGLGSRIRMVSSPHPVPCIDSSSLRKERAIGLSHGCPGSEGQGLRVPGNYIKRIACGGRHSAVITDAGALLTFGWGLYGQCGQGSTDDELSPTCVSSLLGIRIESVAAGLWHTVCISADGDVYAFGGNQFGQLGTGAEQAETLPRLLDAPSLENMHVKVVSCGARHTAVITGDSKVFCWGWNKYGQLGLGDVIDRNIPSQVSMDDHVPITVACGWWHTLLLAESPT
ncbi:ultraviolet-B receptor UVR8 isoform X2 [Solanum lycopersicum]|uniref:ultraviolet-B receptor UVR8 isoform X2 n=1 Tax=Solanum lycopersicum TaxID=4081 RepID=UPI000532C042|nr:ultraviolet-B receptor UVR8 isoform X2 [Solanum lycopersicum]